MATATVQRPAQALRNRRDAPRPSMAPKRASGVSGMDTINGEPIAKKRKLEEPLVRTKDWILRKFAGKAPSLTVHLHQNHFRFDGQDGSFLYDSAMNIFLKHLRKETVPHDMVEELLSQNVTFYDGCLIVEVHNHRSANGKDKGRHDSATGGDQVKFSMHNYNNYVTPSGLTAFPKKAKENEPPEKKAEVAEIAKQESASNGKDKGKNGPHIATLVMFPTDLSQHKEMQILAQTPASAMSIKKKSADGNSETPQLSVPPTPLGAPGRAPGQDQKMALEEQDLYQFQADMLIATEPPLYLDPVKDPQEAQRVLDMLKHPLHSDPPPSPKTRKRTTAELAADDAQAAEAERRMLIMDERIKPAAPGTAETASTSQALGLNRFKTIQMVREKLDEAERQKKEEQEQAQAQRKQEEAAANALQQQKNAQAEQQRKLMNHRQAVARQQQEQMRNQQQQMIAQNHNNHPQQNNMMMNQQQGNFQHPASMAQSSPVVRQQTPMMNSSPMIPQNGFPMTATSSQGAGSPPRPTSAAMPNPNVAMARQISQQQHGSRNATPQIPQSTPNMSGVMPNRQMTQTPRMPHGSPAPGTPAAANVSMANMPMPTPQTSNMTPEQMAMLQQARQQQMANQGGGGNAGSPGQNSGQTMTPQEVQAIRNNHLRQQMAAAQAQGLNAQQIQQMNPQFQQLYAQQRAMMIQKQQQQQRMAQQQQNNAGQAGSPHPGMNHTPQMGHAHPQQGGGGGDMNQGQQNMTPQMRQQLHLRQQANNQLMQVAQQYNGFNNIPAQVVSQLPQHVQQLLRAQQARQNATRQAQAMAVRAQQAQNSGQAVVGTPGGDPEYMQTLRNHQAMLAGHQSQGGQGGGQMNGMSMTHNMNFGNMQNQQFAGQGGQGDNLSQQFQAMQAALNRSQGMGQQQ